MLFAPNDDSFSRYDQTNRRNLNFLANSPPRFFHFQKERQKKQKKTLDPKQKYLLQLLTQTHF